MQVLLNMNEATYDNLSYHWQVYKPANSGVTVTRLASLLEAFQQKPRNPENKCFEQVLAPSAEKLEAAIMHDIGVFNYNLKCTALCLVLFMMLCTASTAQCSGQEQEKFQCSVRPEVPA